MPRSSRSWLVARWPPEPRTGPPSAAIVAHRCSVPAGIHALRLASWSCRDPLFRLRGTIADLAVCAWCAEGADLVLYVYVLLAAGPGGGCCDEAHQRRGRESDPQAVRERFGDQAGEEL